MADSAECAGPEREERRIAPLETAEILTLKAVEREYIERTLEAFGGDKIKSAAALGISLKTLYNRARTYGWTQGRSRGTR